MNEQQYMMLVNAFGDDPEQWPSSSEWTDAFWNAYWKAGDTATYQLTLDQAVAELDYQYPF